jgi:SAM-dependent methyltransferase
VESHVSVDIGSTGPHSIDVGSTESQTIVEKYDSLAEDFSASDYADPERYYAHRAQLVVEHGPRLEADASVLDIACGDGGLGRHLLARGLDYRGVDASKRMVDVARRALGDRVRLGTFDYEPAAPVDATMIFRALVFVPDRVAFFERVRRFTKRKLVFDFDPRTREQGALDGSELVRELDAAGWRQIEVRPFLLPQRARLPMPLQQLLFALEPLPGARLLTAIRFPILVSASV